VAALNCVLALNIGSSSIKFAVYTAAEELRLKGKVERIGLENSSLHVTDSDGVVLRDERRPLADHNAALESVLECATVHKLQAVGHRLVRGGADDRDPQPVTPELLGRLREMIPYFPDHLPYQVRAIEKVAALNAGLRQVVAFDTSFHRRMPRLAQLYPLPRDLFDEGILRYGFHGLSYEYVLGELAREAGNAVARGRVVIAHLGNGCSMAAIRDGRPVDTTMGFTPTGGLMMSSRSGDLDPEVILYLLQRKNLTPAEVSDIVNRKAGLVGVSGTSSDMRDLAERRATDPRAAEAVELFCYQARKFLGAMAAALGGIDTLVFTGGIGENAPEIRKCICHGMEYLGLSGDSVRVIATNEELMIARHAIATINKS
jgi:acetate kinase